MVLIGCDFHPSWQQVSWLDMETGETGEQKLVHAGGEAKQFYEQLAAPAVVHDPGLRKQYRHRCHQNPKAVAKVAVPQISRTTVLDAAHERVLSRDRSHREQLGAGPGRRKLDRRC